MRGNHGLIFFKSDSRVPPGVIVPHQTLAALRMTSSLHPIARCWLMPVPVSTGESIQDAAAVHGVDADALVEELNKFLATQEEK